jgi:hypothetical protein
MSTRARNKTLTRAQAQAQTDRKPASAMTAAQEKGTKNSNTKPPTHPYNLILNPLTAAQAKKRRKRNSYISSQPSQPYNTNYPQTIIIRSKQERGHVLQKGVQGKPIEKKRLRGYVAVNSSKLDRLHPTPNIVTFLQDRFYAVFSKGDITPGIVLR